MLEMEALNRIHFMDYSILTAVGALTVLYFGLSCVRSIWRGFRVYVLARMFGFSADLKSFGEWAVITGATDGIGKGYAHELARKGINVLLISRSPEKLVDIAEEIEKKYNVKARSLAYDFSNDDVIYQSIKRGLTGLDIGVLVNNVGMSYEHPEYYSEVKDEVIQKMLRVNMHSVAMMTKLILPVMNEKKKGVIINIASAAGKQPTALLALYSATKAFVNYFTVALEQEYASRGIIIQCVLPYFVSTKMSRIKRSSFFVPDPYSYAKSALATVGVESVTYGCVSHALQGLFFGLFPPSLLAILSMTFFKYIRKIFKAQPQRRYAEAKQD